MSEVRNFSFVIPGVSGGACPSNPDSVEWLADSPRRITSILSLADGIDSEAVSNKNLGHKQLSIPDYGSPSTEQLQEATSWIDGQVKSGGNVFVHCRAGIGRTGTVLAAYLMQNGTVSSANEAIELVRQSRPGSVESQAQVDSLVAFEAWLAENKK
eukprot:c40756_g1_i1.p1 GENE.c40756_g1_i1~~c40756_g1_i1.p1  ORF type:complete len:166 (+),score=37.07 c40756_g1_i1:32-499(+)